MTDQERFIHSPLRGGRDDLRHVEIIYAPRIESSTQTLLAPHS